MWRNVGTLWDGIKYTSNASQTLFLRLWSLDKDHSLAVHLLFVELPFSYFFTRTLACCRGFIKYKSYYIKHKRRPLYRKHNNIGGYAKVKNKHPSSGMRIQYTYCNFIPGTTHGWGIFSKKIKGLANDTKFEVSTNQSCMSDLQVSYSNAVLSLKSGHMKWHTIKKRARMWWSMVWHTTGSLVILILKRVGKASEIVTKKRIMTSLLLIIRKDWVQGLVIPTRQSTVVEAERREHVCCVVLAPQRSTLWLHYGRRWRC